MEKLKITMTLLVRDEEDVIEDNLWFHHSQGVDSFIVMDNRSLDRTAAIVKSLSRELDIDYLYQDEDNYNQAEWVTQMARRAYLDHRSDWVINNDADEFWVAENGQLRAVLNQVSPDVSTLRVRRHNAILTAPHGCPLNATAHPRFSKMFESVSFNNLGRPLPRKCIHRSSDNITVSQGNHGVSGIIGSAEDIDHGLYILHYPYRSLEQYKRKIRSGGAAYGRNYELDQSAGVTWREHYKIIDTEEIGQFWESLSRSECEILIDRLEGAVFEDRTVASFIERRSRERRNVDLSEALLRLLEGTNSLVEGFVEQQTRLITQFPKEERANRPLFYNLKFCLRGPLRHRDRITALHREGPEQDLCQRFSEIRDTFSLFPRNTHLRTFLSKGLSLWFPEDVSRLHSDCSGRRVILHIGCNSRRARAEQSVSSFGATGSDYHHVIVLGANESVGEQETPLAVCYDGRTLTVPIPDDYENLHRKVFYALTIFSLVADASLIMKVDDSIRLKNAAQLDDLISSIAEANVEYAGREVGAAAHHEQWHGWHLGKCRDPEMEWRGYQYPLPSRYAAGGYGYVLGRRGVDACAYMYLAMKEFFSMKAVGLEDAYVGHAMEAQGIGLKDVASEAHLLAFPGLTSSEFASR